MSPRKIVQDMVPSKKPLPKGIVSVPIHRHKTPAHMPVEPRPVILEKPRPRKRAMHRHPFFIVGTSLVCIAVIVISIFYVYAKAVVTITPKRDVIAVNSTFTACKDTPCSVASSSLAYEVIQISPTELHTAVASVDGPVVQTNAAGNIVIYNSYSTTPQSIPVGTHISNTAGLIYKTVKTVSIPGFKKTGAAATPGSATVAIVAAAPGPQYNIQPTDLTGDFKIVGYKGTDKYSQIYGRLDPSNAISGGFSGRTKIVASTTLATTYTTLKNQLAANLLADARSLTPDGYIMYDNAYSISYTPIAPVATTSLVTVSSNVMDIGMSASLYGVMFVKNDLAKAVALATKPSTDIAVAYPNNSFSVTGLDTLSFAPVAFSSSSTAPLRFTLKGSFTVTGTFPLSTLVAQLQDKNLAQSKAIFAAYSTIATAHATITPFWRHSFPNSADKISVIIK